MNESDADKRTGCLTKHCHSERSEESLNISVLRRNEELVRDPSHSLRMTGFEATIMR